MTTEALPAGLSQAEAQERLRAGLGNGVRSTSSRSYTSILRANLFTFFNNLLFVIGVALLALGRTNDAVVSVGLGLLNAVISSAQELRAKRTLDRLRLLQRARCRVVRDGQEREVEPEQVVQGDLLRLTAGDQVVVDGPVVGPGRLELDESLLTGESDPVVKTAGDLALSGTACLTGTALQRAEAVGAASSAAKLTAAARTWTPTRTPLQARIDLVVRAVMVLVALISAAILLQAALEGLSLLRVVQTSAVLSGLVPYGLFFLVSVSYAVGAAALVKQGALVQQLNAVEALSNVDVVCTDKTGTLTTGRLGLQEVVPV
nr:HAD-IC family P-type ATPase [Actinomycetota bacterium]